MAKEKREEIQFPSLDELFSSQEERDDAKLKRIYEIPLTEIDSFPDHPYKVRDDEDMDHLVESIRAQGLITPATVRKKKDGRYEMISGHRRLRACQLLNMDKMKCEVLEISKDEATIMMVELNQTLGKETIDTFNTGESRGREVSHSLNYQKLGKDLATVDELAVLDGGKCILQLRGVRPFLSDKYDITKHPNYKYLSDADKRNEFDIERFLSRRLKPKPDEVYDVYDIDASVMDAGETAGG